MHKLITIVLVLFGLSIMIAGGAELYSGDGSAGRPAEIGHILGGIMGAGLAVAGLGLGKNLPWARFLAFANLAGMAALSIFNAFYLKGHVHASHHATRALLALFLILSIARLKR